MHDLLELRPPKGGTPTKANFHQNRLTTSRRRQRNRLETQRFRRRLRLAFQGFFNMVHPASETDETLLESCQITFLRRSGPGGQHRNKTETAVIIEHRPSGLRGEANERRSQAENRRLALFRLRLLLATTIREPSIVNDDSGISDLWRSRSKNERLSISAEHTDFPSILAEALDCIADCEFQLDVAVSRLLVSSSQIVKLLKQHRPAFEMVNRERLVRNLGILK